MLDCLIELDAVQDYSVDLQAQVSEKIAEIKVVLNKVTTAEIMTDRAISQLSGTVSATSEDFFKS